MDTPMAVSGEKIKALREARAWSQAHLAEAASLSLRTVQRVEAEGTASAETRLAIAAALAVSVDDLNAPAPVAAPADTPAGSAPRAPAARIDPGPLNTLLMFAAFGVAELFILSQGSRLPPVVATHFGVAGDPNAHMARDAFVAETSVAVVLLPLLLWAAFGWAVRRDRVNIPHAAYWFAEPRRGDTLAWLQRHLTWLCLAVTAFLGFLYWLIVAANAGAPARPALDDAWFMAGLAGFLVAMGAWIAALGLRFRREAA